MTFITDCDALCFLVLRRFEKVNLMAYSSWSPVVLAMGADMLLAGRIALEQLMILLERQEKGNCAIVYEKLLMKMGLS